MRVNGMKLLALLPIAALLSACAGGKDQYPSLALRPFETGAVPLGGPPRATAPTRPATPAARIAELRAAAAASQDAFAARENDAARLARAAAGQPFESNARATAMVALAELDSKRAATAGTLASLDSLAAEAASALSPDPALAGAQAEVAALLARQDATIARLWGVMGS